MHAHIGLPYRFGSTLFKGVTRECDTYLLGKHAFLAYKDNRNIDQIVIETHLKFKY